MIYFRHGYKETIHFALKDLILPEIESIRQENHEIKVQLDLTNKPLDDINLHLAERVRVRRLEEAVKALNAPHSSLRYS